MSSQPFHVYAFDDYRDLLKKRLQALRQKKPSLSWRKLAARVPIQSTYLSKALNEEKTHLSEDHLYQICRWLELSPDEVDFVFLLRARSTAQQAGRIEQLTRKIQDLRKRRIVQADYQASAEKAVANQTEYLFDPLCMIIHCALSLKKYRKAPQLLCPVLGLDIARLKKILEILDRNEYIVLGPEPFEIKSVHAGHPHFGREHPLMRVHQTLLKSNLVMRLGQTSEENKESFFVTMAMDPDGFARVKDAFGRFIKEVREITMASREERVYQLNFDLLEWF